MNVNLKPQKKHLIKKILILILFTFVCFFIKENVFAKSVPTFLEEFQNDYVNCYDNICLEDEVHTFKVFMEYYSKLTNDYILYTSNLDGSNKTIYIFSEQPYFDCNSEKCFIYDSSNINTRNFSSFYFVNRNNTASSDDIYYWNAYSKTTKASDNYIFFTSKFNDIYMSNFDILDANGNILYNATNKDTVDWTDSEDIPSPDTRNWFEKLRDSIIDGFYNLGSFITNLPNNFANAIKDLFVPGEELEGFFTEEYDYIKEQLGFLTYPIEIVIEFADRFYEIDDTNSAVFKIPKLEIFNHTLYEGTEFDLMSIVNENDNIKYLYNIYKIAVSGFIVLWLVQLAIKKEHEIFGGGTE